MPRRPETPAGLDEDVPAPRTPADLEDLVLRMKNTSELMVDLAYGALLYQNREIADEVSELEDLMDLMHARLQHGLFEVHTGGSLSDDNALALLRLAEAAEVIADSADQIADVIRRDVELHPIVWQSIRESDVILTRVTVRPGSAVDGKTLGEAHLMTETGMRVVVIRRGRRYLYGPGRDATVHAGDVLFARGPEDGETDLRRMCGAPVEAG